MNRRQFVEMAAALGATLAWGSASARASKVHRAKLWKAGETPPLERTLLEGTPPLSI